MQLALKVFTFFCRCIKCIVFHKTRMIAQLNPKNLFVLCFYDFVVFVAVAD